MAIYELRFRKSVSKDPDPIPKRDVQRIIEAIQSLADDPRPPPSRKLSGAEKYRLRCGVYRVLHEIHDDIPIICVVKVGLRKDVHRK